MTRGLTAGERRLAEEAFGDGLALDPIRFLKAPWPLTRAFVPGVWFGRSWIVWPEKTLPEDIAAAGLGTQAVFVHELTHVWQAQQGLNLITGKLRAGDSIRSYEYPVGVDCDWATLNIEQQAMVVEHKFRLRKGGKVPADAAFYDRVCPLGARMEI